MFFFYLKQKNQTPLLKGLNKYSIRDMEYIFSPFIRKSRKSVFVSFRENGILNKIFFIKVINVQCKERKSENGVYKYPEKTWYS